MKLLKRFLIVWLAVLMLVLLAIYLTPLDVYVPEFEQVLSGQLHEPVKIRHVRIALMPFPHLELRGFIWVNCRG